MRQGWTLSDEVATGKRSLFRVSLQPGWLQSVESRSIYSGGVVRSERGFGDGVQGCLLPATSDREERVALL